MDVVQDKPKYELSAKQRSDFSESAKVENCVICLEDSCNTLLLCCLSSYHVHCLGQWLESGNQKCAHCRKEIHWLVIDCTCLLFYLLSHRELEKRQQQPQNLLPIQVFGPLLAQAFGRRLMNNSDSDDDRYHFCHDCGEFHM